MQHNFYKIRMINLVKNKLAEWVGTFDDRPSQGNSICKSQNFAEEFIM